MNLNIIAIKFQNQKQSIVSPTDGYVAKLMINTIGGVVTPAEKLISIVPKDSPLIVKVNVLNQDIGFVKKDMQSKIKIDAGILSINLDKFLNNTNKIIKFEKLVA